MSSESIRLMGFGGRKVIDVVTGLDNLLEHDLFKYVNNPDKEMSDADEKIYKLGKARVAIGKAQGDLEIKKLYREKFIEVAAKTAMIKTRNTPEFTFHGDSLYIDRFLKEDPDFMERLRKEAKDILEIPLQDRDSEKYIGAHDIEEAFQYALQETGVDDKISVEVIDGKGIRVDTDGTIRIGQDIDDKSELGLVKSLSHELFHAVCVANGMIQPDLMRPLMTTGLPGYELSVEGFTEIAEQSTMNRLLREGLVATEDASYIMDSALRKKAGFALTILDYASEFPEGALNLMIRGDILNRGKNGGQDSLFARDIERRVKRGSDNPEKGHYGRFSKDIIYLAGNLRVRDSLGKSPLSQMATIGSMDVKQIGLMENLAEKEIVVKPKYEHKPILDVMVKILEGKYRK